MPIISKCCICNITLSPDKAIKCDKCKNLLHSACSGLSESEVHCIINKERRIIYHCDECNKCQSELLDLKQLLVSLKSEIDELKNARSQIQNTNFETLMDDHYEDIIQEINERQLRKGNIIVYGAMENNNAKQDIQQVQEVLAQIDPIVSDIQFSAFRLGKFDPNNIKPSPIKVILKDEYVRNIVIKSSQLKRIEAFKHLSISFDRTPKQISYYRKIKKQLDERVANGETNLKIKYVRGIPKIINLN
ncbi:hypothetical protein PPYR_09847 [Photinus pyralis]|uniref:PHD-type domain-containing protein n=1 Tax=Photinus pyralis TaxID=7054 RepID=A0A5N4AEP6_PHOPY|nr:hypothetical protein PPYR_09847 [Photinus pyralis]